jgi:CheY-like chemotaxis protein
MTIGVTGNAMASDVDNFICSGAKAVLIKPVTKIRLTEELAKWGVK